MTVVGHIQPIEEPLHPTREDVPELERFGVVAFTTTRSRGTFALHSTDTAFDVFGRWQALLAEVSPWARRLASAHQVHGDEILEHQGKWEGWLRAPRADGHLALQAGTAMAVSIADCVPVFIAHPSGATALVHSGWKGTVAHIAGRAIQRMVAAGLAASDLVLHCGPAICGGCYEVSPDVYGALTGRRVAAPTPVDLRAVIAEDARSRGVTAISTSPWCTRCHNTRFFSHRCGDAGRQVAVIAGPRAG
ncbi:MAG: polyphenol oxidase family protein [Gemmatimonadaceae bacterium]